VSVTLGQSAAGTTTTTMLVGLKEWTWVSVETFSRQSLSVEDQDAQDDDAPDDDAQDDAEDDAVRKEMRKTLPLQEKRKSEIKIEIDGDVHNPVETFRNG
jgi:hypothetical protein